MTGFRIAKKGYSVNPWRVVWPDGTDLYRNQLVTDGAGGETVAPGPVAGPTKAAAVDALGDYAYALLQAAQALQEAAQEADR